MIAYYLLGGAALGVLVAYACRVDLLTWWRNPVLMLLHVAGGIGAAWALKGSAMHAATGWHAVALAGAVLVLLLTWRHLPGNSTPAASARQPAGLEPARARATHRGD